jgi:hypothetical protein
MVVSKLNTRIITEVAELLARQQDICQQVAGEDTMVEIVKRMFTSGIIDERRCKIALVRRYVNMKIIDNQRKGKRPDIMLVMSEAAEAYCVTETFVQNCMYKFRNVNL